jgi:hypothetical protein
MILVIGKQGKTLNVLDKFLETDNSYFITDTTSVHGLKTIADKQLGKVIPEEKQNNIFYISDCDLIKLNNLAINKRMRNSTLIVDSNLLMKHTLKDVKKFEFYLNVNLIMTFNSIKEDEIKEIHV